MKAIIQMHIDELDEQIIQSLRSLFKDKNVLINISDSKDETNFLLPKESHINQVKEDTMSS